MTVENKPKNNIECDTQLENNATKIRMYAVRHAIHECLRAKMMNAIRVEGKNQQEPIVVTENEGSLLYIW